MLEMVSERNKAPLCTAVKTVALGVSMIFSVSLLCGFIVIEQHVFPFKVADFIVAADMNILSWAADCCNSTKVYEKGTAVTRLRQAMSQADVRLAIMPATEAVSAYLKYWSSMSKCEPRLGSVHARGSSWSV